MQKKSVGEAKKKEEKIEERKTSKAQSTPLQETGKHGMELHPTNY
jgi:hypothetical protein